MNNKQKKRGFFSELRRREVFSTAAYYFAIAWGGIEIFEWVLGRWQVATPHWLMPLLAAALVVGFPVSMLLAWMYDFDRVGIHRAEAYGGKGVSTIALAAILMLGGTGGLYWLIGVPESTEIVLPPTVRPKLAVLPFDTFSSDPNKTEFADAIHYELLNNLSKLNSVMVISRQSVLEYRGSDKSIPEIALELGVNTLLTGAVQRAGDRVRINLSLRDGKNDAQVWSEDFNFRFTPENYFEVQGEVAESIAEEFEMALGEIDRTRISSAPTGSLTAYEAFLMARVKSADGDVEGLEQAEELLQEAIRLDPDYAQVYAALAGNYYSQAMVGTLPLEEMLPMIEPLVNKALSLDPNLVEAYLRLAHFRWRRENRLEEADAAYRRAIEISPNAEGVYDAYATFLYFTTGRHEVAVEMRRKALELNPRAADAHLGYAWLMEDLGRLDEAARHFKTAIELQPGHVMSHWMLGLVHTTGTGDYAEGMRYLEKAAVLDTQSPGAPAMLVFAALDLAHEPLAAKWAAEAWRRAPDKWMSCLARVYIDSYRGRTFEHGLSCYKLLIQEERGNNSEFALQVLRDLDLREGEAEAALNRYRIAAPRLFESERPEVDKNNYKLAIDLHPVLLATGQVERANQLLDQALEAIQTRPRLSTGGYGWADVEILALQSRKDEALTAMRSAIAEGMRSGWWQLGRNRNLESLWDEPAFQAMLAEIERDMIARREVLKADTAASE